MTSYLDSTAVLINDYIRIARVFPVCCTCAVRLEELLTAPPTYESYRRAYTILLVDPERLTHIMELEYSQVLLQFIKQKTVIFFNEFY
jgi:hypothetical protein